MKNIRDKVIISLDVATKKTGIAMFVNGNYYNSKVIDTTEIMENKNGTYAQKASKASLKIVKEINDFNDKYMSRTLAKEIDYYVAFEVSSVGNNRATSEKLKLFVGMYLSALTIVISQKVFRDHLVKHLQEVKFIHPNQWGLRAFGKARTGDFGKKEGKIASIKRATEIAKVKIESDDEADAINIASLYGVLNDESIVKQYTTGSKKKKAGKLRAWIKLEEAKLIKYEAEVETRVKKGLNPTTKALQEKIDNARTKIAKYKMELEEINSFGKIMGKQ